MQSTWMFKPKYSVEVVQKVLKRICGFKVQSHAAKKDIASMMCCGMIGCQ